VQTTAVLRLLVPTAEIRQLMLPGLAELRSAVEAQGRQTAGDMRERYVTGPESGTDSSQWCTELDWPLVD
jgi:hypothetical protein